MVLAPHRARRLASKAAHERRSTAGSLGPSRRAPAAGGSRRTTSRIADRTSRHRGNHAKGETSGASKRLRPHRNRNDRAPEGQTVGSAPSTADQAHPAARWSHEVAATQQGVSTKLRKADQPSPVRKQETLSWSRVKARRTLEEAAHSTQAQGAPTPHRGQRSRRCSRKAKEQQLHSLTMLPCKACPARARFRKRGFPDQRQRPAPTSRTNGYSGLRPQRREWNRKNLAAIPVSDPAAFTAQWR